MWSNTATTQTVSVSATGVYSVFVTDVNNCSGVDTVNVTINPNPTITVSSNTTICSGISTTLTASGATTYTWMPLLQTGAAITVTPAVTSTYTAVGTLGGCNGSASVVVTVLNGPVVTTTVTAATCPSSNNGSAIALGTGTGTITYTWMPGGMNTSSISGLSAGVYIVTVGDAGICQTSATVTVTSPAGTLQTTFAGGNGQNGNMFDVVATNQTFITSFDCHVDTLVAGTATDSVKIYYIPSTYVGQNANPGAWTYLGGAHVVSAGIGVPTSVPVPVNVTIPAGQTHGFYITRTTAGKVLKYTNGATFGASYASNSDFAVNEGNGVAYPFGIIYPTTGTGSRIWNGIIYYCNAIGVEQHFSTFTSLVYPQPLVDYSIISISGLSSMGIVTLKVYDAMGKLVKESVSTHKDEINLQRENLNGGMYFYTIYNSSNEIIAKGKLMVQ